MEDKFREVYENMKPSERREWRSKFRRFHKKRSKIGHRNEYDLLGESLAENKRERIKKRNLRNRHSFHNKAKIIQD